MYVCTIMIHCLGFVLVVDVLTSCLFIVVVCSYNNFVINLSILNSVVIGNDGPCCVSASLNDVDLRVNHITRTAVCFLCGCVWIYFVRY